MCVCETLQVRLCYRAHMRLFAMATFQVTPFGGIFFRRYSFILRALRDSLGPNKEAESVIQSIDWQGRKP